MTNFIVPETIETYAELHTEQESPLLKELAAETYAKMEYPQMQVGVLEGAFLRLLVRMTGAKRILELGTFTGYSSLCMAEALPEDGELITCDIDPSATDIAKKYWGKSPYGKKISLRLGPALETIQGLSGAFDLVFVDADKENYSKYWDACLPKLKKGGLMVIDNVLWSGRVLAPEEESDHAIVAFNKKAKADPRVEPVMVTVRDGMLLAYKK